MSLENLEADANAGTQTGVLADALADAHAGDLTGCQAGDLTGFQTGDLTGCQSGCQSEWGDDFKGWLEAKLARVFKQACRRASRLISQDPMLEFEDIQQDLWEVYLKEYDKILEGLQQNLQDVDRYLAVYFVGRTVDIVRRYQQEKRGVKISYEETMELTEGIFEETLAEDLATMIHLDIMLDKFPHQQYGYTVEDYALLLAKNIHGYTIEELAKVVKRPKSNLQRYFKKHSDFEKQIIDYLALDYVEQPSTKEEN